MCIEVSDFKQTQTYRLTNNTNLYTERKSYTEALSRKKLLCTNCSLHAQIMPRCCTNYAKEHTYYATINIHMNRYKAQDDVRIGPGTKV